VITAVAIALLITPSTKTDVALMCTDPDHSAAYRVPAERNPQPEPTWIFVHRADAVCVEALDHQSHFSPWFGNRHTHRDRP
jgi:hypothetical protein